MTDSHTTASAGPGPSGADLARIALQQARQAAGQLLHRGRQGTAGSGLRVAACGAGVGARRCQHDDRNKEQWEVPGSQIHRTSVARIRGFEALTHG